MSKFKTIVVAGAAAGLTVAAAQAADLGPAPILQPAPVVQEFSGWYLRGNIGMTNQSVKSIAAVPNPFPNDSISTPFASFDASPLAGLGVGYQVNNWLRVDATGEYRSSAHFHGQQVDQSGGVTLPDDYNASKSEWLFLANAYVDLGTWWCITPFVGAGVGMSRNTISGFRDDGVVLNTGFGTSPSTTFAADGSKWNFAWALHAGLAYKVAPGFTVELAYRYINLGDGVTGVTNSFDGVTTVNGSGFLLKDITSQDVKLGVRWELNSPPVYAPPPLIRKG
jgi:opacity protein-like surface antigen